MNAHADRDRDSDAHAETEAPEARAHAVADSTPATDADGRATAHTITDAGPVIRGAADGVRADRSRREPGAMTNAAMWAPRRNRGVARS